MVNPAPVLLWLSLAPLAAQSLEVYSEFRRVNLQGAVVAADRGGRPREILSPAVARNAYASFHLVVSVPQKVPFLLYVGQNPEKAVSVEVYREVYIQSGGEWIPDRLEPVTLPVRGMMPEDATSVAFWLDVWVSDHGPARRIKLEPQLNVGDRWIIYPMEVRIKQARVPPLGDRRTAQARLADPADTAARGPLRSYLCGTPEAAAPAPLSIRRLIARNARQDMALARSLEAKLGREKITAAMLNALEAGDRQTWCAAPVYPTGRGPEWYLRIRDFLLRAEDP